MATSDAEQPAAEPAAVEPPAEVSKSGQAPRVKPLPKPDRAAFDAELAKLQAATEKATARLAVLDAEIKEKNASRKASAGDSSTAASRARLAELNAVFKARMDEKAALREELTAMDAARDRAREELKSARGALRFRSPEEITQEVARLQHMLEHTTMPLNEEKKLLLQIKELSKSRDDVKAFGERSAKLVGSEDARKELVERIRAKDAEITAAKADKGAVQATLSAARAKEESHVAGLPALHEERDKVWQAVRACRDAVRKLRDEHKAQEDVWWANEKLWRSQQKEEKQKRWEEGQAERKARAEARRKFEEENAPEPYTDEVTICDQLVAYLSAWAPEEAEAGAAAAPAAPPPAGPRRAPQAPVGAVLVGKKGRDEGLGDQYAVAKKGGGGKKQPQAAAEAAGGSAPPAAAAAAKARPANERITHSLDALASFTRVGLAPPPCCGDVVRAKTELAAKKARYLELRAGAVERKAATAAAQAAAAAAGTPFTPPPPDARAVSVRLDLGAGAAPVKLDICVL